MSVGGALIGPLLGGIAILDMSFKSYFALASVFLLTPFLVILARTNGGSNLPVKQKNFKLADASNQYKALTKNKSLVSATIIESINGALFITFSTFIIVLVIKDLSLSPGVAAMLIALKGGATICVVFFGGQLFRKNNNSLYLFSFIVTILALLVLGISRDILQISIASVVLGLSSGLITLITFTQVGNIEGEKGKIAGIFSFGFALGSILGPTLGGMIGDIFSVQMIFLSFIPLFGIMALYTFMEDRQNGINSENIAILKHDF